MEIEIFNRDGNHPHNIARSVYDKGVEEKSFSFKYLSRDHKFTYYPGKFSYWDLDGTTTLTDAEVIGFILAHVLLQKSLRVEFDVNN